ncbi:MAG: DsbA family protein [Rhodobacteraceae bacterium]|nr:DsbA family protein [Paracoccaceae bacterium]
MSAPSLIIPALTSLSLLASPVQAIDLTSMSDAERTAFRAEVRAYLLDNPEVIIEAVNLLEERQASAKAQDDMALVAMNADDLFDDGYSWVGGNPEGDITLVEFLDYRCGYCRRAMPEVEKLIAADGNIRLIVKELPILGENSMISSRFAVATKQVAGADAYKDVHDALMALGGDLTDVALRRVADGLGLDTDAIMAQMDSDAVTNEIATTHALAQRLQISGTPSFVLHDEMLRGYLPAEQMAAIVAEKRKK